nr:ferrous iron transporter B [Propionibacterium sp.]
MSHDHHGGGGATVATGLRRFALVGSPNSGKSTLFNALTGLRAKVGNYPGVTVSRYEGVATMPGGAVVVEDLPGTYSLDAISPDEQIVADVLHAGDERRPTPDALLVTVDATTLRRSLAMVAQVLNVDLPATVVVTFGDELAQRAGRLDLAALGRALGVPVLGVPAADPRAVDALRRHLADVSAWERPVLPPPTDPAETRVWIDSVLAAADYAVPQRDRRTARVDAVLLHPLWGSVVFFATMFGFFQVIFTLAAPLQDAIEALFGLLGGLVAEFVTVDWLARFLAEAVLGGVGGVLVFLPQIALLFAMIALLEGVGYMSRAAFLMDRVMARFGLEGRAFVALLSAFACAIPGIIATRSLPSARDRLATMLAAPIMTCSARLPVYVMLIALLVPAEATLGPFGAQGVAMFGLYVAGALAAMATAWVFGRLGGRRQGALPFYMEMPPYRLPRLRTVVAAVWDACVSFVRKVATIILTTTIALWALLSFPLHDAGRLEAAGIDPTDQAAVAAYTLDRSYAAGLGRAVQPVFEPLGFDWRVNVGVIASLTAREVFVATMGQIAAAEDPEDPGTALAAMTVEDGPRAGEPLFTPSVLASLLVFFMFALQCFATIGVLRRETGGWRWPLIAFGYMFALAWTGAFVAGRVVGLLAP